MSGALADVAGPTPPPAFALLHRQHTAPDVVDVLIGTAETVDRTACLPVPRGGGEVLAVLPYRQLTEVGLPCRDDGAPILTLRVDRREQVTPDEVAAALPDAPVRLRNGAFDLTDAAYAALVMAVQRDQIGTGAGSNFVLRRSYRATVGGWDPAVALALFRRLLSVTTGAHWTFLIHTPFRTFLGASPERHVGLHAGVVTMNPISGTYRYPPGGPTAHGVLRFLADGKETNELYMVVDEELKMMSRMCDRGGWVHGPYLRQMRNLAHTEYVVEGETALDSHDVLRHTMFAPTVIGSPLRSAADVISRYESTGRSYYAGVAALIGEGSIDSVIMIRTAEVDSAGQLRLDVGATLVRDSAPDREAAETAAKAATLLDALNYPADGAVDRTVPQIGNTAAVRAALSRRNGPLSPWWMSPPDRRSADRPLLGRRILIVDAEDGFTAMGRTLLASLGADVVVRRFDEDLRPDDFDCVVAGPGPGDPRDHRDPRIVRLQDLLTERLGDGLPTLAVCLSHQILCAALGIPVRRRAVAQQGVQRRVEVCGRSELVYFYNTYAAFADSDRITTRYGTVSVDRDAASGEVHALRGRTFAAVQFHPSSVMTPNGRGILRDLVGGLLTTRVPS
ncbi:anthranilate synthase family protein [Solwaraspora sp. WMMB335]|uniref:anthranilate synthase family protein n=1 Tax=Solwaraspora sp. WMMB335 TaxID=3404118 RepID=UPI003B94B055